MSLGIDSSYRPQRGAASDFIRIGKLDREAPEKLALAIPTLREAENLPVLLERVRTALDSTGLAYEVIVVDDDSQDGTEEIVNAIGREDARVRLLVRKGERGLSGAILYGWSHTDASILGVMDADLQHPPELLPRLVDSIRSGKDLAIGSRYTPGGELGKWNFIRRSLSKAAVLATWPIQRSGLRAHDPMTGYFLLRRASIEEIAFQKSGFKLLLEVLVRAHLHAVEEIPFSFGLRERGMSKANAKVGFDYAKLLVRLYALRFGFKRG